MYLNKILLCLAAAAAFPAPDITWPWEHESVWPWEVLKCEPYDEDTVMKNTYSVRFYSKANCAEELERVDSDSHKINECHKVNPDARSFHGVGHTKYAVTRYSDRNCTNYAMTAQWGHWEEMTGPSKKEIQSFYISMPADRDPWPRQAICWDPTKGLSKQVTPRSKEVCDAVQAECWERGKCQDQNLWIEDAWVNRACNFTTLQLQDCEDVREEPCQRPYIDSIDKEETLPYVPCRSSLRSLFDNDYEPPRANTPSSVVSRTISSTQTPQA